MNNCKHDVIDYVKRTVNPPLDCNPFTIRFNVCRGCGYSFATTKQRRKNRHNFTRAIKSYTFNNSTHGIYY